jgi:hypothetical protein
MINLVIVSQIFPILCVVRFGCLMSERKRAVLAPPKSKATSTTAAVNTLEVTTKAVVSSPVGDEPELQVNAITPIIETPLPRRKHRRVHHQHHHLNEQKSLSDVGEDISQTEGQRSRGSPIDGGTMVDSMWKWWKEDSSENLAAPANTGHSQSSEMKKKFPLSMHNSPFTDNDSPHPSEAMAALKDAASGTKRPDFCSYLIVF